MRLNDFETIDEVVQLGKVEFSKRSTAPTIDWIPSRQNIYSSQCIKYSNMLLEICNRASNRNLIDADMNPSQFVKAAQDFQLAARMAKHDTKTVLSCFMKLANIGMMLKRYNYRIYVEKVKKCHICEKAEIIEKAKQLNGLLRAFSEAVYFDDHTISGEFYGNLYKGDRYVVVRSYKRLCPNDLLDGFDQFKIRQIETYSFYETAQVDFDCLGNIQYMDNVQPIINGFYCEYYLDSNDRVVVNNVSEMDKLINALELQLQKVLYIYKNMTIRKRQCLLLNAAYYAFKPILDILSMKWQPTEEDQKKYIDSLIEKTEFTIVSENMMKTQDALEDQINRIIDPRIKL